MNCRPKAFARGWHWLFQRSSVGQGFRRRDYRSQPQLRHNSKGKIIPIAAFVVGLESIVSNRHSSAVSDVTEGAANWRRCPVVEHCEDRSERKRAGVDRTKE